MTVYRSNILKRGIAASHIHTKSATIHTLYYIYILYISIYHTRHVWPNALYSYKLFHFHSAINHVWLIAGMA